MGKLYICESCKKNQAKMFCACTKNRIYLCRDCIVDHTVKYPDLMHQLVRADLEVSDLPAYRLRNEAFAAGSAELQQNLTQIDQCCQEVTAAFDAVIESLGQWRDYYVRALQEWKVTLSAEIAEAENEVKSTLAQDSVQLTGKYSALLRNYQPGTLQLFTYEIDTSGFANLAQSAVKFQYAEISKPESHEPHLDEPRKKEISSSQSKQEDTPPVQERNEPAQEALRITELARSKTDSGNYAEAIKLCADAEAVYSRLPDSIDKAINLTYWGMALKKMRKPEEAVTKYAAANVLYSGLFPDTIENANNLYHWGIALNNVMGHAESALKHAAADAVYSHFPDTLENANNLHSWGVALNNIGKSEEAVEKYAAAEAIYSRLFPDRIEKASNLDSWRLTLLNMGQGAEAVRKSEAARLIYASKGMAECVRTCG